VTPVLQIRERQNKAFLLANPEALVELVQQELRDTRPELVEGLDPLSFREMVVNAVARARRRGLTDPEDLAAFGVLAFVVAPNFDDHPRIRKALEQARGAPPPVFLRVVKSIPDEVWDDAAAGYDAAAWFSEDPVAP
jgi:hypothetical protein